MVEGSGSLVSAATTRMLFMSLFALIVSMALARAVVPDFNESVKSAVIIPNPAKLAEFLLDN